MQGITDAKRAKMKSRLLDIIVARPEINMSELGRILGIDRRTAQCYKKAVLGEIVNHTEKIEGRIAKEVMENVSIWQKIKSLFQ